MIIGMKTEFNVINKLHESKFNFYLTGSRYFGNDNDLSDWDFFVQEPQANYQCVDLVNHLLEIGFIGISKSLAGYDDSQCVEIFRYLRNGLQIDIQVVRCAETKNEIQKCIRDCFNVTYANMKKVERRELWKLLYSVWNK